MSEERKYYHTDIESGEVIEVSKETYDNIKRAWNAARPVLTKDGKRVGKVAIYGTGGELSKMDNLERLFYEPQNYNTKKWEN